MNIVSTAALGLALTLAACGPSAPADVSRAPLAGARIGGPFALVDQDSRTVTERSFAGRYPIVYFGYTFCPDVCPTDMQALGTGLKQFEAKDPALAAKVVPVFVTVDPARDTPAVLKEFVAHFHPRAIGLTGSADAIARTEKAYAVYARKGTVSPGGGYAMDHSSQAYLMGLDGQPIALMPTDQGPDAVAAELAKWVR